MADYLQHWQAKSPVFTSAPDTNSLFFSEQMKQFSGRLRTGFVQGLSVMALAGSTGCGKSTLLRWIYDSLDPSRFEVLMVVLFKTETTSGWLAPRLASMLGINHAAQNNYGTYLAAIGQRLDEIRQENRRLVIMIDACERIQHAEALQEISALTDAHLTGSSVVSILLVGSDQFQQEILNSSSTQGSPLAGRVGWCDRVPTLATNEGLGYISSRLVEAGLTKEIFSLEAADLAARLSNGNLHLLNSLCENALVDSAEANAEMVTMESVQRAARFILHSHLNAQNPAPSQPPNAKPPKSQKSSVPPPKRDETPQSPDRQKVRDQEADVPLQSLFKQKASEPRKKGK